MTKYLRITQIRKKHDVQKNILGWLKSPFQFFLNIQNELFGPPHIK